MTPPRPLRRAAPLATSLPPHRGHGRHPGCHTTRMILRGTILQAISPLPKRHVHPSSIISSTSPLARLLPAGAYPVPPLRSRKAESGRARTASHAQFPHAHAIRFTGFIPQQAPPRFSTRMPRAAQRILSLTLSASFLSQPLMISVFGRRRIIPASTCTPAAAPARSSTQRHGCRMMVLATSVVPPNPMAVTASQNRLQTRRVPPVPSARARAPAPSMAAPTACWKIPRGTCARPLQPWR